jgi:hypothetical protein
MPLCNLIGFIIDTVPLRCIQGYLMRHHVDRCRFCEAHLISRADLRVYLGSLIDETPRLGAFQKSPPKTMRTFRWALAAAGLAVCLGIILMLHGPQPSRGRILKVSGISSSAFKLNHLYADGKAVDAIIIQSNRSDAIIIWVDRNLGAEALVKEKEKGRE